MNDERHDEDDESAGVRDGAGGGSEDGAAGAAGGEAGAGARPSGDAGGKTRRNRRQNTAAEDGTTGAGADPSEGRETIGERIARELRERIGGNKGAGAATREDAGGEEEGTAEGAPVPQLAVGKPSGRRKAQYQGPEPDEKPAARRTRAELAGIDAEALGAVVSAVALAVGMSRPAPLREAWYISEEEARGVSEPLSRIVQRMSPKGVKLVQAIADPIGVVVGVLVIAKCCEERERAIIQALGAQGVTIGAGAVDSPPRNDLGGGGASNNGASAEGEAPIDRRSAIVPPFPIG